MFWAYFASLVVVSYETKNAKVSDYTKFVLEQGGSSVDTSLEAYLGL